MPLESNPNEEKKFIKREPSRNIGIKELRVTAPPRIAVAGMIISKNEEMYSFMLDDGEGTVLVITNNVEEFGELKEGQFVRVLGKTWGEGEELEIQADIFQDFSKVDPVLYKKFLEKTKIVVA